MRHARLVSAAVLLASTGLAAVAALAAPPPAADPPLIPRRVLLGNPERTLPRLAPDGDRISWLAPDEHGVLNVWAQSLAPGAAAPKLITNEPHRPIAWYDWAGDGRHVLYLQDSDGDENAHLWSADLDSGNVRDLTPFRGIKAQNVLTSLDHPGHVLAGLNLRDRKVFDMVRIDLATGAITPEATNPGDVLTWTVDQDFTIRAATAFDPASLETKVRIRDGATAPWRDVLVMPFEHAPFAGQVVGGSVIAGFAPDNRSLLIHSAMRSDNGRLVRLDPATGAEAEVLAEDAHADIADGGSGEEPSVLWNPRTKTIAAVEFDPGQPRWAFLDKGYEADFARIGKQARGFLRILSRDRTDRRWIVSASRSDAATAYFVYDRETQKIDRLFDDNPELAKYPIVPKRLVVIPARDGKSLVSYLTLPAGTAEKPARPLPLVLDIHGGPWFRFYDDYDPEVQLLANRGYAVLEVNYRGSTGFGVGFLNLGTHEWGRGTQEDLYDAVRWAIARGIADPKRIAALGWSGGGYGTLLSLEQKPELFACGVDGVGPADIATLFHSFPPYWGGILARWRRRVGDVEHDAALNRQISPLYHVDAIRSPLLIGQGQNDPRVTIANVDAMVKALREAKREVTYVVYPDEGHGFARPENNLDFYGRAEEFLARCLGGRAEPWQAVPGSTAEVR